MNYSDFRYGDALNRLQAAGVVRDWRYSKPDGVLFCFTDAQGKQYAMMKSDLLQFIIGLAGKDQGQATVNLDTLIAEAREAYASMPEIWRKMVEWYPLRLPGA